jgi:glycine cleavage system H protein
MAGDFPQDVRYTESDEWVRQEGNELVCGITGFASDQLGDVVYVQLPEVGKHFEKGDAFGEIESVKAVSDLYCPLTSEVVASNQDLDENPGMVNQEPYGGGWIVRLRPNNPADYDSLLDPQSYERSVAERA